MLRIKSGLGENSFAVINYFKETLNIPLQKKHLSLKNTKTLKEWYDWACDQAFNSGKCNESQDKGKPDNWKKKEELV